MKKEFIPYKLAVKLVELGFNDKSFDVYSDPKFTGFKQTKKPTPKILFQQAFRFFREKHKLSLSTWEADSKWFFAIKEIRTGIYFVGDSPEFNTYEEAELACLEKLIELTIKN